MPFYALAVETSADPPETPEELVYASVYAQQHAYQGEGNPQEATALLWRRVGIAAEPRAEKENGSRQTERVVELKEIFPSRLQGLEEPLTLKQREKLGSLFDAFYTPEKGCLDVSLFEAPSLTAGKLLRQLDFYGTTQYRNARLLAAAGISGLQWNGRVFLTDPDMMIRPEGETSRNFLRMPIPQGKLPQSFAELGENYRYVRSFSPGVARAIDLYKPLDPLKGYAAVVCKKEKNNEGTIEETMALDAALLFGAAVPRCTLIADKSGKTPMMVADALEGAPYDILKLYAASAVQRVRYDQQMEALNHVFMTLGHADLTHKIGEVSDGDNYFFSGPYVTVVDAGGCFRLNAEGVRKERSWYPDHAKWRENTCDEIFKEVLPVTPTDLSHPRDSFSRFCVMNERMDAFRARLNDMAARCEALGFDLPSFKAETLQREVGDVVERRIHAGLRVYGRQMVLLAG